MTNSPSNIGDVEIDLAGEKVSLRCTLGASIMIEAISGNGLLDAYQGVQKFRPSVYPVIVAAGVGKTVQEVSDAVFATGMDSLQAPLTKYLSRLSNGGRDPVPASAAPATDAAPGNV